MGPQRDPEGRREASKHAGDLADSPFRASVAFLYPWPPEWSSPGLKLTVVVEAAEAVVNGGPGPFSTTPQSGFEIELRIAFHAALLWTCAGVCI
jgi:hypothetical protein